VVQYPAALLPAGQTLGGSFAHLRKRTVAWNVGQARRDWARRAHFLGVKIPLFLLGRTRTVPPRRNAGRLGTEVKFRLASLPGFDSPTTAVQEHGTNGGRAVRRGERRRLCCLSQTRQRELVMRKALQSHTIDSYWRRSLVRLAM
jgi:hypothetical protein